MVVAYIAAAAGRPWELSGAPKLDLGTRHPFREEAAAPLVAAALDTAGRTTSATTGGWSIPCPAQGWAGCFVWQRGDGDEPRPIAGIKHRKLSGVDGFAGCTTNPERAVFIDR